jgi:threonine dehydrogenase-like Zn-dependent dehydrogenase
MPSKANTEQKVKRKRGGQPGNLNALKHGFYSRQFRDQENLDLEAILAEGLDDEIAMLRVAMRRYFEVAAGIDDIEVLANTVGIMGMAATRLASLLRVRKLIGGGDEEKLLKTINQAIAELTEELGLSI